ncbi:MAG: LPXTG cell wall anchor domain-containing protein [Micrococcaceae bacterium]|nr:LPXTG cell wall anchor domain-containing protein [Micrococcaceae bacterium]
MKELSCSPTKRGGKKLAAFGLSAAVVGGALLVVPGAQAASNTQDNYWGSQYGQVAEVHSEYVADGDSGDDTTWIGGVGTQGYTNGISADNGYTWCIQWSQDANGINTELPPPAGTSEMTGTEAQVANIIVAKHADDGSKHPEIALAMHELFDHNEADGRDGNAWAYEKANNNDSTFNSILDTANSWIEEAEQYTGDYTIQPEFDFGGESVTPGSTGKLTNLNVMAGGTSLGSGVDTVGNEIELTVELTGTLQFSDGETTKTLSPGDEPEVEVTGAGMIGATVETSDALPNNTVTKVEFGEDSNGDLLQDRVTHQAPVSIDGAIPDMQVKHVPSVTTETSEQRAEPGTELFDKITVDGVPDDKDVTVTSTLYYAGDERPERQEAIPETAEAVGSVETVVTGSGTYETPTITIEESGYYVWVETIEGTETMEPWTSDYGITEETSLVPWSPEVKTMTSQQRAEPEAEIYDTLMISGNKDGKELTVDSTLYGPFDHREEQGTELPEDAPVVGKVSTVIEGNGEFQTEPLTVEDRGYYFWVETIEETDETDPWGDEEDESPTWQEDETTIVPWEIISSSDISDRSSHEGGTVHDTVWFAGLPWDHAVDRGETFLMAPPENQPQADGSYILPITEEGANLDASDTGEAELTMYGPFETMPERSDDIPEDAPVHDVVTIPAVNGEILSADFKEFEEVGYYTIVTSFDGSDRVEPYVSEFGIPSESTYVPHPDEPGEPVPEDPPEPVTPEDPPVEPTTPDQVEEVSIDSGNPGDNTAWALGAGAGIALIGLGGYLAYRRKNATGLES